MHVPGATLAGSFNARNTVAVETPASLATSVTVDGRWFANFFVPNLIFAGPDENYFNVLAPPIRRLITQPRTKWRYGNPAELSVVPTRTQTEHSMSMRGIAN